MKQVPYRLAEALESICKRKSLENITVSQIAQEAGVTRQVFIIILMINLNWPPGFIMCICIRR